MIPEHIANRKSARSLKELDPIVLEYLNTGKIATKNLVEWLATDQLALLQTILGFLNKMQWYTSFETAIDQQKKPTSNSNVKIIGQIFATLADATFIQSHLSNHTSDKVTAYIIKKGMRTIEKNKNS